MIQTYSFCMSTLIMNFKMTIYVIHIANCRIYFLIWLSGQSFIWSWKCHNRDPNQTKLSSFKGKKHKEQAMQYKHLLTLDFIGSCELSTLQSHIRVTLSFNWSFGRELIVLHAKLSMFGKFLVHPWNRVEVWMKNFLYRFSEGQIHFDPPRGTKMNLPPNELEIKYSSFEPPHRIQACTENLLNMESIVCNTTNSRPILQLS